MRAVCVVLAAGLLAAGCGKKETVAVEEIAEREKHQRWKQRKQ